MNLGQIFTLTCRFLIFPAQEKCPKHFPRSGRLKKNPSLRIMGSQVTGGKQRSKRTLQKTESKPSVFGGSQLILKIGKDLPTEVDQTITMSCPAAVDVAFCAFTVQAWEHKKMHPFFFCGCNLVYFGEFVLRNLKCHLQSSSFEQKNTFWNLQNSLGTHHESLLFERIVWPSEKGSAS